MKFNLLYVSSVSACFELENTLPYYSERSFDVVLNGEKVSENVKTNVFSVFDLTPDTEYTVEVLGDKCIFKTNPESVCLSVHDFGAVGDGKTDDTLAIQNAIYACPANGRVTIEKGTYYVRPIMLKSDITLELKENAILLGDTDESHYPVFPGSVIDPVTQSEFHVSSWEGLPHKCHQSFISAFNAKNINIVGRGIIDANAENSTWWINPKNREVARPKLVFLNKCENVVFHGITGQNSPSWNFHPFFSKSIYFYDTAVIAPKVSPNTDGSDPESCDDVRYIGMRFAVGDDAIAIKSGKMYMGMKYKTPASNHLIRNCLMEYAHGAVVLGSEMSGGIRDLTVSQCYFSHTDRGLRIKTRRGRGKYAVVDGVEFSNIKMENVLTPLVINMYYYCDPDGKTEYVQSREKQAVDDGTPYLGAFSFHDIECVDAEWAAGYFFGLPEMPIKSIDIENMTFTFKQDAGHGYPAMMSNIPEYSKAGLIFNNVGTVRIKNVQMTGEASEEVELNNVQNVVRE